MSTRLAYGLLPLILTLASCASQSGIRPSPHYAKVTRHLDVGGDVLLYADVEGDLAAGADHLDKLIERLRKTYPELKLERIVAKRLLRQLGLEQVLAVGLSSARDGKVFHNRSFLQYGNSRQGLLLLTGAAPRELELAGQAPRDTDLAFETELKLKSLLGLVEVMAKDVLGKEAAELFAGLDEKLPGTALSLRQLANHLDTKLLGVVRVDEQRAFVWPGDEQKTRIPGIDLLLAADGLAVLFDAYQGILRDLPNVKSSVEGDLHWLEIEVPIPGAAWLRPVLAKNAKSGRLFLATSKAFVKELLADKKADGKALAQAADFKRATARFQPKANALTYMSGAFIPKLARFMRPLGKSDAQMQAGIDLMLDLLPEGGIPFAAQQVNLPDGLFYASYATTSHKSTLFSGLAAAPMVMAGVAAAGMAKYLRNARALSDVTNKAELPVPEEDSANEAPDQDTQKVGQDAVERIRVPLGGPSQGAAKPLVSIVEFSDFQCPFCGRAATTVRQLVEQYPSDVRLYFRQFPLSFHADAALAAQAALAAEAQGKFWPMHDRLLANQGDLKRDALESYAQAIGLDMKRFKAALDSHSFKQAVDDDIALAGRCGVSGTPTFFINGRLLGGARPIEAFKEIVDDEIARAKRLMASGTPRVGLHAALTEGALERVPPPKPEPGVPELGHTYRAEIAGAPTRGARDALVTIVQFSDYQCPFCRRVEPTLSRILRQYKGDVRVVWRDMPLPFHPLARPAALAARAAGEQGKYWEMHDKLVSGQDGPIDLEKATVARYAGELGLDMKAFAAAIEHKRLGKAVDADADMASKLGVRGTPAFFINGKFLSGAQPFETFKKRIDEELKAARKLVAKGTPRAKVYDVILRGARAGME